MTSAAVLKLVITVPWGVRQGGAENILWGFLRHVDRRRIEPVVVFLQAGPFEREVAGCGFRTTVIPAGRLRQVGSSLRVAHRLAALLRQERPDLLLNWSSKTQLYGALAAALAGMPGRVVWWQQGIPAGHWLERMATLLPARAVGCYSQAARDGQGRHRPRRRTFVVHPGIDVPVRCPEEDLRALRQRLAMQPGGVVVGIVGRLQLWKGQDRFLRALAELRRRGYDVRGLIVGGDAYGLSPGYDADLHKLARDLGLDGTVTFTGQVEEAGPYVQIMDISVNASLGEPFGLVLLEAMALGVPVVAFNAGGPAEILDASSGLLVPLGDEPGLAGALERLIVDPLFRRRLGAGGEERFRTRFTAARMTEDLSLALESLRHG